MARIYISSVQAQPLSPSATSVGLLVSNPRVDSTVFVAENGIILDSHWNLIVGPNTGTLIPSSLGIVTNPLQITQTRGTMWARALFNVRDPETIQGEAFGIGQAYVDGNGNIQQCSVAGSTFGVWQPNTVVALGVEIVDPNGNIQKVTTAGTTGATEPTFTITTTPDGTATWTFQSAFTVSSVKNGTTIDGTATFTNVGPKQIPALDVQEYGV